MDLVLISNPQSLLKQEGLFERLNSARQISNAPAKGMLKPAQKSLNRKVWGCFLNFDFNDLCKGKNPAMCESNEGCKTPQKPLSSLQSSQCLEGENNSWPIIDVSFKLKLMRSCQVHCGTQEGRPIQFLRWKCDDEEMTNLTDTWTLASWYSRFRRRCKQTFSSCKSYVEDLFL